jgi:hypothetical protein
VYFRESWPWSYSSWIDMHICNQRPSLQNCKLYLHSWQSLLDTTLRYFKRFWISICIYMVFLVFKFLRKNKKKVTVRTVLKSKRKIIETKTKLIHLIHIYFNRLLKPTILLSTWLGGGGGLEQSLYNKLNLPSYYPPYWEEVEV